MKEVRQDKWKNTYIEKYNLASYFSEPSLNLMKLFHVEHGEEICMKGNHLGHLYMLVDGKVKIYTLSPEGKSLILRFKTPLALIGDVEYVKGTEVFNTVEAVSDAYFIGLSFDEIKNNEQANIHFSNFLLEFITHKFYTESHATSLNMLYPVEVRLASYLLSLSEDGKGSLFYEEMRTSNLQEFADVIGTSYRHLNRVLQEFQEQGIIEKKKGMIKITNLKLLRQKANDNIYE